MPSSNTISNAIKKWNTAGWPFHERFDFISVVHGKKLSNGGSGQQSYLEGAQYKFGDKGNEKDWCQGHVTLTPGSGGMGHCGSFHLTITGGTSHRGNYFFTVNEHQEIATSGAPVGFKGKSSRNGSELPAKLVAELTELMDEVLND